MSATRVLGTFKVTLVKVMTFMVDIIDHDHGELSCWWILSHKSTLSFNLSKRFLDSEFIDSFEGDKYKCDIASDSDGLILENYLHYRTLTITLSGKV